MAGGMMTGMSRAVTRSMFVAWCCLLSMTEPASCQPSGTPDLPAVGDLLVATSKMPDRDWAASVVLLIYSDRQGVMGLILNRPTEFPLSHLFPEIRSAAAGKDPLYFGGLIALGAKALVRSSAKLEGAQLLNIGVSLITQSAAIERAARTGMRGDVFRVYAGYAGWSPGQLRNELLLGHWRVLRGDTATVFDPHPETLWRRLSRPR